MTLVACIGGGQLGRMLGLAGLPLGLSFRFLDPAADACAGAVGERLRAFRAAQTQAVLDSPDPAA